MDTTQLLPLALQGSHARHRRRSDCWLGFPDGNRSASPPRMFGGCGKPVPPAHGLHMTQRPEEAHDAWEQGSRAAAEPTADAPSGPRHRICPAESRPDAGHLVLQDLPGRHVVHRPAACTFFGGNTSHTVPYLPSRPR